MRSEILNLFQNNFVNSLSYFFLAPVQIQCPSLYINQALLLLFPVIGFELPITRTFFDFPRGFELSSVDTFKGAKNIKWIF